MNGRLLTLWNDGDIHIHPGLPETRTRLLERAQVFKSMTASGTFRLFIVVASFGAPKPTDQRWANEALQLEEIT